MAFDPRGWRAYLHGEMADAQRYLAGFAGDAQEDARSRGAELRQRARCFVAGRVHDLAASRDQLEQALRDLAARPAAGAEALPDGATTLVKDYALYYLRKLRGDSWL